MSKALILGGGGITGIAWELGMLAGLYAADVDVRDADLAVGTSAGSNVGAQISSGRSLDELLAVQLAPVPQMAGRTGSFDTSQFQQIFGELMQGGPQDPRAVRARIGALALAARTLPERDWLAGIAMGLPSHEWSEWPLLITAVDTASGEPAAFDRNSGVPLVAAVAASCAVPGVFPPVTIDGHRYMDGGMRSATNADLAAGYDRVLILDPLSLLELRGPSPLGGGLHEEIALLERQGSRVLLVAPDEATRAAFGPNVLDPSRRAPAAQAGKAQAAAVAEAARQLWLGA